MKLANNVNPPMEEALEHYGVLGMKWGVRRTKQQRRAAKDVHIGPDGKLYTK